VPPPYVLDLSTLRPSRVWRYCRNRSSDQHSATGFITAVAVAVLGDASGVVLLTAVTRYENVDRWNYIDVSGSAIEAMGPMLFRYSIGRFCS
jgi:hypothetical protein